MDIQRPDQSKAKRKKRIMLAAGAILALGAITFFLARLKPAAPTIDKNMVWIGTVKRGPMIRQVRGIGTLVPEDIRWIAARTSGRVDKIRIRPGAAVTADTVILELSNPDVQQAASTADSQLRAAEAKLVNLKVQLESGLLANESAAAQTNAEYQRAKLQAELDEELFKDGLVSPLDLRLAKVNAEESLNRNNIEQKRVAFARENIPSQLSVAEADVEQSRATARLRHEELDALFVRAGVTGVLQLLPVDEGQQIQPGANLARVADPTHLKAEVHIAETQAKDIQNGQLASIDTRNGIISGKVIRVEPAVQNGTVLVDVGLEGELPRGARPDLSVDGTIELERLADVINVGRPAFGQENSKVGIFKLDSDGVYAVRIPVQLGRSSVNTIEIVNGLQPGDQVILSDMSQWDSHDRVKLN